MIKKSMTLTIWVNKIKKLLQKGKGGRWNLVGENNKEGAAEDGGGHVGPAEQEGKILKI